MMKDYFLESQPVQDIAQATYDMWSKGWDESNGGNMSYLLDTQQISLLKASHIYESDIVTTPGIPKSLNGKYILITASGSQFRTTKDTLKESMGVIKLHENGYQKVWGFNHNTSPTSEFYMHILAHDARLKVDPKQRVVVHNHATDATAMSLVVNPTDSEYTLPLWKILTESIVTFPDGVGILPWQLPGTEAIGIDTAQKLSKCRIVVWAFHGILATGKSIQDCFGLIETVNKAAGMYLKTLDTKHYEGLTNQQLIDVCNILKVSPRMEIFD